MHTMLKKNPRDINSNVGLCPCMSGFIMQICLNFVDKNIQEMNFAIIKGVDYIFQVLMKCIEFFKDVMDVIFFGQ